MSGKEYFPVGKQAPGRFRPYQVIRGQGRRSRKQSFVSISAAGTRNLTYIRRQCLSESGTVEQRRSNQEAGLEPEPLLFWDVRWSNPLQGECTLEQVDPKDLRLPPSPIPRPGERVLWHAEAREMAGVVQGHDIRGQAIILDDFGLQHHRSFDDVRLRDPFSRMSPNWCHLPSGGRLLRPGAATLDLFRRIMAERIPPGPSYQELVEEFWGRGYEVFLVGGTARDTLAGKPANDIDLVTTMPLTRMLGFVQDMYLTRSTGHDRRGYIRLGGTPESGDPFIDVKIFSNSLPGTNAATFGVGFARDFAYRDFACNAVYYDSKNEVIIDPSGHGVSDCDTKTLRLAPGPHDRHQKAQVFIRAVKFMARGFSLATETRTILLEEYQPMLATMKGEIRLGYFKTQVMSKHRAPEAKRQAVADFKAVLEALGCPEVWGKYFASIEGGL